MCVLAAHECHRGYLARFRSADPVLTGINRTGLALRVDLQQVGLNRGDARARLCVEHVCDQHAAGR